VPRPERKYALDTNLFITAFRRPSANEALQRFHRGFAPFEHLSAIVEHELRAGAQSAKARRLLEEHLLDPFHHRGRTFAPSTAAWAQAGDVLAAMQRKEKLDIKRARGSFRNDLLLAASCREAGIVLVTDNARDFARIREYLAFTFVPPWPGRQE
jgi:tRNA(fMet)-specific endonuclease VapC